MRNILHLFEQSASLYPNKTAVAEKEASLTFSELLLLSRRYGAMLRTQKMTNQPVAVFAERSINTLAMFLGVLYSGNYYVPLDPALPHNKLSAILGDCLPVAVLGDRTNGDILNQVGYEGVFFSPDDLSEEDCPFPSVGNDDPMYMIYTSGSTGKPKGVLKSHRSMISFIEAYCNTFDFTDQDIIGNQTPFFFDASAKDIYLMIKTGATLEIIPVEYFSFPVLLVRYLNERKVTFISWVPSALCIVTQLNTFSEVIPLTLKKVFFVGEVFPIKQLQKWFVTLPQVQFVNLYGSTEIAGISLFHQIREEDLQKKTLPIGKPLQNCEVLLMDSETVINEPEKTGEICVSSDALAIGYYRDEEKNAASFLNINGKRIFRTGDLAWYDNDGALNFSSRSDFQIKHMGRRIELGEIEAAADQLEDIQRCCCLYNEKKKRITLFCELNGGSDADGRAIQSALRGKLSEYMVPGRVIIVEKIPLNANGKVDRNSLKELL